MGVEDEPDRTGAKPAPVHAAVASDARKPGKPDGDRDIGASLRSVYQKTIEEQVPDEFLDLLGKLK